MPVGFAGVEEYSYPVVVEGAEAEADSFDLFYEVVDRFCGSVRDGRFVPVGDFFKPTGEGASEGLDFDGVVLVLEVGGRLAHEGLGEGCVADVVYGPDYLVGVPCGADFSVGIAGCEQAGQLGVAFLVGGVHALWSTAFAP